jgi:uncharacterized protein (TIGR01777 family)
MQVLVTGSHGLVGSQLVALLTSQGHQVVRLVRKQSQPGEISWNPERGELDKAQLEGFDAVVHLAGDNIASGRWTAEKKARIRESRVGGTTLLCHTLASLKKPPAVLVSASAIGYYGDRGEEVLTEESSAGKGFLAEVCQDWETSTKPAQDKGIRTVMLRIGVVLSTAGGALKMMLPPFKMGVGGNLGSGKQYMSWIALEDLVGIIQHVLVTADLNGPLNAVAPNPVTNSRFTEDLGKALHRPTIFPVPQFAAHLLLGEMADELLYASCRVLPKKLFASNYAFAYPELDAYLQRLFSKA